MVVEGVVVVEVVGAAIGLVTGAMDVGATEDVATGDMGGVEDTAALMVGLEAMADGVMGDLEDGVGMVPDGAGVD